MFCFVVMTLLSQRNQWFFFTNNIYFPIDLDQLVVHSLQHHPVLHSGSVLQRFLSDLLPPLQPLLDHADAAEGPPLLPAVPHHSHNRAAAQVHAAGTFNPHRNLDSRASPAAPCDFCVYSSSLALITSGVLVYPDVWLCFISRYFYRACQNSLVPSPVQMGRLLDKASRNIRSHGSPKSPFLSLTIPSPKVCNKKDSKTTLRSASQDCNKSEKGLCSLVPTQIDSLNTKDPPQLSGEPQLPPKVPECLDKTLETSGLSLSGCITSTPLLTQTDSVQLTMPPDGDLQRVRYTRTSEGEPTFQPAQRTEPLAEHLLHTSL